MTLNNLVGNECPTEIAKLINAIIAQKATNSLDNLDAAGQQKFTDLANSITNVNDLVTALSALVNTKLSAEALLEQNGYIKFSNGVILQWGIGFTDTNISLPVGYPYYKAVSFGIHYGSLNTPNIVVALNNISNLTTNYFLTSYPAPTNIMWITLGY